MLTALLPWAIRKRRLKVLTGRDVSAATSTLTLDSFSATSGTWTYTPRDAEGNALGAGVPWSIAVDAEARVSASLSSVTANPSDIINDGADSSIVTLNLVDEDSDPVVGFAPASAVLAVTGSSNTVTQPSVASTVAGAMTGSFVSTAAATKTASYTAAGLAITDTASVVVSAGSVTTFASSQFTGGTISPFTNPWGDRISVIADPTGSGRGNIVQILYAPSSGGSMERGIVWSPVGGVRYGEEIWFKGDVHIVDSSGTDADWSNNHNRKLIDWQGTATRLTLNRNTGNDLRISIVDRMDGTEDEVIAESTGITLLKDTWYTLEVRMVTNSADGVRDGIVEIYVNGAGSPSYTRTTNLGWITESGGATSFVDFIVGMQLTINSGDPVYEDTRYWDNVYFSDGRLP